MPGLIWLRCFECKFLTDELYTLRQETEMTLGTWKKHEGCLQQMFTIASCCFCVWYVVRIYCVIELCGWGVWGGGLVHEDSELEEIAN